jgi:hypothetical protein
MKQTSIALLTAILGGFLTIIMSSGCNRGQNEALIVPPGPERPVPVPAPPSALPPVRHSSGGPIVVGGGAGESEYSMVFAREKLTDFVGDCLTFSCGLGAQEKLRYSFLTVKAKNPLKALFKTSKEMNADLYQVHSHEVWFNRDRLWLDTGKTKPYDIVDAVRLWVEILALGSDLTAPQLEALKTALGSAVKTTRSGQSLNDGATFETLLWSVDPTHDRLYIRDPSLSSLEITPFLIEQLKCPSPLERLRILNPAWVWAKEGEAFNDQKRSVQFLLSFDFKWACEGQSHRANANVTIKARSFAAKSFEFLKSSLSIDIGEL